MRDWSKVQKLYVKNRFGEIIAEYNSWKDFGWHNRVDTNIFVDRPLKISTIETPLGYDIVERFNVIDEMGLVVPIWKLEEAAELYPSRFDSRRYFWKPKYDPETFRRGPVPGIRNWKASSRGFGRKIGTFPERRDNSYVDYDEDCVEYRIKVRGKRKGHILPSNWDDIPYSDWDAKSWKNHRKTQYR